jgi:RNA polymerase sigma factor (sigma-70 family)
MESVMHSADPPWSGLVEQIRNGDPSALEQMYRIFSTGIRFYLCRQLGPQDLDDRVHDVFLIIIQSIQKGELREPERLMGYVRTIVRRHVAAQIDDNVKARRNQADLDFGMTLSDHHPNPERNAIERQNAELAMRILNSLPRRDREVLARFYLDEQPPDRICREMGLTETQFRLVKSRAKARFGELGKTRFSRRIGFRS